MARRRDFDAAASARDLEPIFFTVRGDDYEAIPECPGGLLLDLAAANDSGKTEASTAVKLLDAVLTGDSAERFKTALRRPDNPISLGDLTDIIQWLVEEYTGRPTQQPSASPDGLSTSGPGSEDAVWSEA